MKKKRFEILYSLPPEGYGSGMYGCLFEELKHAKQFIDGEYIFEKTKDGWDGKFFSLNEEMRAKIFAASSPDYFSQFGGSTNPNYTQLGMIQYCLQSAANPAEGYKKAMQILKQGGGDLLLYYQLAGQPVKRTVNFDADPIYHALSTEDVNSPLLAREFSEKIMGYPYKR